MDIFVQNIFNEWAKLMPAKLKKKNYMHIHIHCISDAALPSHPLMPSSSGDASLNRSFNADELRQT